jgi:hypothetical protein
MARFCFNIAPPLLASTTVGVGEQQPSGEGWGATTTSVHGEAPAVADACRGGLAAALAEEV